MDHEKLSHYYPWSGEGPWSQPSGYAPVMLVLDKESRSAEFAVVYMIISLLKQHRRVLILCCNHPRSHYESLIRKHTLDPKMLQQCGQLRIITVSASQLGADSGQSDDFMDWSGLESWAQEMSFARLNSNNDSSINSDSPDQFSLVIDDLDALEIIAPDAHRGRRFLKTCLRARSGLPVFNGRNTQLQGLVMYGRESGAQEHGRGYQTVADGSFSSGSVQGYDSDCPLTEYLKYQSDLIVTVSGLPSGYSLDIHGSITIQSMISTCASSELSTSIEGHSHQHQQTLLFKALDTGVKVFKSNRSTH